MKNANLRQLIYDIDDELHTILNPKSSIDNKIMDKWLDFRSDVLNEIGDNDCLNVYIEHDYNPESDRTTMYQITMNGMTGEIESIRLYGWHQGEPYEGDENEPGNLAMIAIL